MPPLKRTKILNFQVYSGSLEEIPWDQVPLVVNTINAYSYVVSKKDARFREALATANVLLPDGFPVVIAARIKGDRNMKKIAGADILQYLLQELNRRKGKCFFLGSGEETLTRIRKRLEKEFPGAKAMLHSPPFKDQFSAEENQEMIEQINAFQPEVLFVGMTAPKQEKWVRENLPAIRPCIICSIGAAFDFYAGTNRRPSPVWVKLGLEWFIRLIKEPGRLWRRYLVHSPIFFTDLFKELILGKRKNSGPGQL